MALKRLLSMADVRNQAVADALFDHPHVEGSGLIVVSLPSNGFGSYRQRRYVLSIDGGKRMKLLRGSTFHPLAPGTHRLRFGWWLVARASAVVSIPADGQVRVEYQPRWWPWQTARVAVADVVTPSNCDG